MKALLVKCPSVQWQPDGLTIHTQRWFLGAGFPGAPPISLSNDEPDLPRDHWADRACEEGAQKRAPHACTAQPRQVIITIIVIIISSSNLYFLFIIIIIMSIIIDMSFIIIRIAPFPHSGHGSMLQPGDLHMWQENGCSAVAEVIIREALLKSRGTLLIS